MHNYRFIVYDINKNTNLNINTNSRTYNFIIFFEGELFISIYVIKQLDLHHISHINVSSIINFDNKPSLRTEKETTIEIIKDYLKAREYFELSA